MGSVFDRLNIFRFPATSAGIDLAEVEENKPKGEHQIDRALPGHLLDNSTTSTDRLASNTQESLPTSHHIEADLYSTSRDKHAGLSRSRHATSNAHAEVQIALQRYLQLRAFVRKSQREFTQLLQAAQAEGHWAKYAGQLCELSDRVEADFAALDAHVARLKTSQGRLANLDFKKRRLEDDLFTVLDDLAQRLGIASHFDHGGAGILPDINGGTEGTESTKMDPLLENYYDKAGECGLLRRRVIDLDIEHQEKRTRRVLLAEQERPISPSDSIFERQHRETRIALVHELETAVKDAEIARIACLDADLHPEDSRHYTSEQDVQSPDQPLPISGDQETVSACLINGESALQDYPVHCSLTAQQLRRQERLSDQQTHKDGPEPCDKLDERSLHIEDWFAKLGSSPPDSPKMPTREQVKAMESFRGDPQASFVPIKEPRRYSSITHLRQKPMSEMEACDLQQLPQASSLPRRTSLPHTHLEWDLVDVLRTAA